MVKDFQRDVAIYPRDVIFTGEPNPHTSVMTCLSSVARCVVQGCTASQHTYKTFFYGEGSFHFGNLLPFFIQPRVFEEATRNAESEHFDRARADLELDSREVSNRESQMSACGRKQAKADAIARLSALWASVAPRIILIGSRISSGEAVCLGTSIRSLSVDSSSNFVVSGDAHK